MNYQIQKEGETLMQASEFDGEFDGEFTMENCMGSDLKVQVTGDLNFGDHGEWREMFEYILAMKPQKISLDLTDLVAFDSAALGLILIFHAKAVNEKIKFEIIQPETGFLRHALGCTDIICPTGVRCNPAACHPNRMYPGQIIDTPAKLEDWEGVFGFLQVN